MALVIGQIQRASATAGQSWISEPGLLQTFGPGIARQPTASYKLYSAPQLVDTSGTTDFLAQDVPADWAAHPDLYTDLNESVRSNVFGNVYYPILDPAAAGAISGVTIDPNHDQTMPVAWIYEMRDGTLGPASIGTKANPIVGRFAFWTDDETSKVNLNTAVGGTFWETPHGNSTDDATWGSDPPAAGEFPRYPGHPAATTLAEIFDSFSPADLLALAPRYAAAGAPLKADRLYGSVDEVYFGTGLDANGARVRNPVAAANPVSTAMLENDRFVLTADSVAPETTMLGEPRVAIWPVSTSLNDPHLATAADRAIVTAATAGGTGWYFQRSDPQSATTDLDGNPANHALFATLLARANRDLPGCATRFSTKYPGACWPQLMLEIADFIHALNAVDPSPAPFQAFAAGNPGTLNGLGFVVPLRTTAPGSGGATLRGLGRCPTLSSLVLVVYVSGFEINDPSKQPSLYDIDYDETPDNGGTSWGTNFAVGAPNNEWNHVIGERLRAFIVPTVFDPACGFPEVDEDCQIKISGLDQLEIGLASTGPSQSLGFSASATSDPLDDALKVAPADRAWGGEEGPVGWRAAASHAETFQNYAFADHATNPNVFTVTKVGSNAMPPSAWSRRIVIGGAGGAAVNLTVQLLDPRTGAELQNLTIAWPSGGVSFQAPTVDDECDQSDHAGGLAPSFYMTLANRIAQTGRCRHALIQAGDVSYGLEAATDLRDIAALASVPSSCFAPHPGNLVANPEGGSHLQNLRFADGSSACFATGTPQVLASAAPPAGTDQLTVNDWRTGQPIANTYQWFTAAAPSVPLTGPGAGAVMPTGGGTTILGDWSAGPGLAAEGATTALPDAGTTLPAATAWESLSGGQVGAATQRAPNALVPSPVVFGSLPAGINPGPPVALTPWRTLLFCPYPAAGAAHPGFADPPDALILDNFWMPVVEPYAVSTPFATAGKVNLNDTIAPFTYLHRHTALRALLHDLRVPAVSAAQLSSYKTAGTPMTSIWQPLDEDATAAQFAAHGPFLSESEVCSVPLVPKGVDPTTLASYWSGSGPGGGTSDDLRELPYALLYGRLAARSNSYTVHVRAQVLQKLPSDPHQNVWDPDTDLVLGDWRGSYVLERYLDPAATAVATGSGPAVLGPYHFRVVRTVRFTP